MEYSEVEQKIKEVEGYLVEGEDRILFEKAKNLPDYSTIIEIGSFKGKSSVAMGYACKETNKLIYCIDPWIAETYFEGTKHEKEDIYNIFLKNRNDNNLQDYLIDIKDYSTVIMPKWKEIYKKPVDLVFIDGDHSFKGVNDDFIVSYPHVKEGGIMIFQDVATYFEGCEDFWYNIGSKKLINHSYFHSLAMGIKPFFKDTLEYKSIEDFIKQKNYTIANQLLKALSFDYPYSIELKIIDSINDYNNNSFSESKYKLIKILEENTDNLPLIYEIYNSFLSVHEACNYLTNIINIDKKTESKSLETKENDTILDLLNENNQYLFSCIVINEELNIDYLKRTIKNILTQKYSSSIEIIVLNNEKIHHSFFNSLEKENNIKIISFNENSKVENYNKALKMAKGKYLKIFTVYEIIKNDFFEKVLSDFTINQDASIVYYDFFYCDKTVDDLPYNNYKINASDVTLIPEITDMIYFFNPKQVDYNFVWKKELHDVYGYFNESLKSYFIIDFMIKISQTERFHKINTMLSTFSDKDEKQNYFEIKKEIYFLHNSENKSFLSNLDENEREAFLVINKYKKKLYNYEIIKNNKKLKNSFFDKYIIVDDFRLLDNDIFIDNDKYIILKLYSNFQELTEKDINNINKKVDLIFTLENKKIELDNLQIDIDKVIEVNLLNIEKDLIFEKLKELENLLIIRFSLYTFITQIYDKAMFFYNNKEFTQAEKYFDKLLIYSQENYNYFYFSGLCKAELKKYEDGLENLILAYEINTSEEIMDKITFYSQFVDLE